MLKHQTFKSRHPLMASSLLALLIMAFASAANAQGDEAPQLQMPDEIVDVDLAPSPTSVPRSSTGETTTGLCEQPEHWLYAKTYKEGEMASHGGKVWKAIKTTEGDMPGMNEPAFWEQIKNHCSVVN
ncbi:hypothetical protein [Marinobacter sp.]|uniref:hypothetical protein n=1 Tax=Marinobacter sp. TaxID=50741 RepID=UPI003A8E8C7A